MPWPLQNGREVPQALGVVPHAVAVDDARAGRFGDGEHAAVDIVGDALDHEGRRFAEAGRPVGADEIGIAADAARTDDNRRGAEGESAGFGARGRDAARRIVRRKQGSGNALDATVGDDERVDAVAEADKDAAGHFQFGETLDEGREDAGSGAPGDVEARHGVPAAFPPVAHPTTGNQRSPMARSQARFSPAAKST